MKTDVNVSSKINAQKNILSNWFFVGVLKGHGENNRIRIPDPLVKGMDPRIRIHTQISVIWNNVLKTVPKAASISVPSLFLIGRFSPVSIHGRLSEQFSQAAFGKHILGSQAVIGKPEQAS